MSKSKENSFDCSRHLWFSVLNEPHRPDDEAASLLTTIEFYHCLLFPEGPRSLTFPNHTVISFAEKNSGENWEHQEKIENQKKRKGIK